mmetsp:Transcript_1763/g.2545  ORF Transcript_1763/g.2545 Transcript_1763/m.2545 type:complete len:232 (+) Transcript_1763:22-717(+)
MQFPELIHNQEWGEVRRRLKSKRAIQHCQEIDESNLNCLAMAVGYSAPVDIIKTMIEIDNRLLKGRDIFGATPLHVACLNGAPVELIDALIQSDVNLAEQIDFDHRTPLHHAVEFACQSGNRNNTYIDVIESICRATPEIVLSQDKANETPIDLVQYTKAKESPSSEEYKRLHEIYVKLRETSIKIYREKKIRWELEGYMKNLNIASCGPSRSSTSYSNESNKESQNLGYT